MIVVLIELVDNVHILKKLRLHVENSQVGSALTRASIITAYGRQHSVFVAFP